MTTNDTTKELLTLAQMTSTLPEAERRQLTRLLQFALELAQRDKALLVAYTDLMERVTPADAVTLRRLLLSALGAWQPPTDTPAA